MVLTHARSFRVPSTLFDSAKTRKVWSFSGRRRGGKVRNELWHKFLWNEVMFGGVPEQEISDGKGTPLRRAEMPGQGSGGKLAVQK